MNLFKEVASKMLQSELKEITTNMDISNENAVLLKERIAELELAREDQGWDKLMGEGDKELSWSFLKEIRRNARLYYLKNPLILRAVKLQTQYVFGQGVEIEAEDKEVNVVVQSFLDDPKNRTELTEHQARMTKETELQLDANLYFVLFTNISTGRVRLRTIPVDEITDIITDPKDAKTPLYYKRVYVERTWSKDGKTPDDKTKTVFYPDWKNKDGNLTKNVSKEVVYHVSVNKLSDWKFGVSEVYAAIAWAKAHKEFLSDWATIIKSLSRFAWKLTAGSRRGMNASKDTLQTGITSSNAAETNPSPATGSILNQPAGINMNPIKTAGSTTGSTDGDRLIHMVCAAQGIYFHYLIGDPSTGNLATAKAMERPMEIMFKDRQTLWKSILTEILNYVVEQSVIAKNGRLEGTVEVNDFGGKEVTLASTNKSTIIITFPELVTPDSKARVESVIAAATLGGKPLAGTFDKEMVVRLLLQALAVDDIDEIIKKTFPGEGSTGPEPEGVMKPSEEKMNEALKGLVEIVKEFAEANESAK